MRRGNTSNLGVFLRIALYISCGLLAISYIQKRILPPKNQVISELNRSPAQRKVRMEPFEKTVKDITYTISPQYSYELYGLIVSEHRTDSMFDYYHNKWKDLLNVKDVCVIWGDNIESQVYKRMKFKSGSYTCYVSVNSETAEEDWQKFDMNSLSNNHLLSEDPKINKLIKKASVGDQISFQGYLSQYSHDASNFSRGTSTTRTDKGNGACETIYVTDFKILKRTNNFWHFIYNISKFLIVAILLLLVVDYFNKPFE